MCAKNGDLKLTLTDSSSLRFELLETLLWEPEQGFFLGDLHLQRMTRSAAYFGFAFDRTGLKKRLWDLSQAFSQGLSQGLSQEVEGRSPIGFE